MVRTPDRLKHVVPTGLLTDVVHTPLAAQRLLVRHGVARMHGSSTPTNRHRLLQHETPLNIDTGLALRNTMPGSHASPASTIPLPHRPAGSGVSDPDWLGAGTVFDAVTLGGGVFDVETEPDVDVDGLPEELTEVAVWTKQYLSTRFSFWLTRKTLLALVLANMPAGP